MDKKTGIVVKAIINPGWRGHAGARPAKEQVGVGVSTGGNQLAARRAKALSKNSFGGQPSGLQAIGYGFY